MKKCSVCGKWYFGRVRYCPKCRADLWYEKASRKRKDYPDLLNYAERLCAEGREEKAGVMASAAVEEILHRGEEVPFYQLRAAVRLLTRLYTGETGCIPDELMTDALDYLEERTGEFEEESCREEVHRLRKTVSGWIPEAADLTEEQIALPYRQEYWNLPPAEMVLHSEGDSFAADLTRTKGLSLTEICYLFYCTHDKVFPILFSMDEPDRPAAEDETPLQGQQKQTKEAPGCDVGLRERLLDLVFSGTLLARSSAGPAAEVFGMLMQMLPAEGREALSALYNGPIDQEAAETLQKAAEKTAEKAGLFPESLLFCGLICPLLCRPGPDSAAAYEWIEPGMRQILRLIEDSQNRLKKETREEERAYLMQLIQTLCTEYSNIYAVVEYERAKKFRLKGVWYRRLLESAAGNGLSAACAEAARCWFFGENGFEVHMEYAKYYTVILKLRALAYPIADAVDQVEDLKVRVPGLEE